MRRFAVILFAVAVAAVGLVLWNRARPGDGPVEGGVLNYSQRLEVGEVFSVGQSLLCNHGTKPAEVKHVRLLGVTGPLELLGIRARTIPDQQDRGMFLGGFGFPPPDYPAKPIADENVVPVSRTFTPSGAPEECLELVIGVRATAPGVARARGVEVSYRVGKRRYREIYENKLFLCAPAAEYPNDRRCPPPELEDRFDDRILG
jgi:hypothetical protein